MSRTAVPHLLPRVPFLRGRLPKTRGLFRDCSMGGVNRGGTQPTVFGVWLDSGLTVPLPCRNTSIVSSIPPRRHPSAITSADARASGGCARLSAAEAHTINRFVSPERDGGSAGIGVRSVADSTSTFTTGIRDGMSFWAVCDVNDGVLTEFAPRSIICARVWPSSSSMTMKCSLGQSGVEHDPSCCSIA